MNLTSVRERLERRSRRRRNTHRFPQIASVGVRYGLAEAPSAPATAHGSARRHNGAAGAAEAAARLDPLLALKQE